MRLLKIHAKNEFSLVDYSGRDLPPYAILSHTWGNEYEEVTFDDQVKAIGRNDSGFR